MHGTIASVLFTGILVEPDTSRWGCLQDRSGASSERSSA